MHGRHTLDSHCRHMGRALAIGVVLAAWSWALPQTAVAGAEPFTVEKGIPYETVDGQTLALDAYIPGASGTHPGLLLLHGGAFQGGYRDEMHIQAQYFAEQGYVAFTIDYRKAPEALYPAPVEDAAQAVAFVRENAARFHLDPTRIGALGSAPSGSAIAASLGTECGRGGSDGRVAAVAAWSGPLDFNRLLDDPREDPRVPQILNVYVFGDPNGGPDEEQRMAGASPVNHVGPGSAPMFLAFNYSEPFPFDQISEMRDRLQKAHVPVEVYKPGPNEPFGVSEITPKDAKTLAFLNQYVANYQPTGTEPGPCRLGRAVVASPGSPPNPVSPPPRSAPPVSTPSATPPGGTNRLGIVVGIAVAAAVVAAAGGYTLARRRPARPTRYRS
jgi:acetyl esterase/lipase